MPCYPKAPFLVASAIAASAQPAVADAAKWRRHQFGCVATGKWVIFPEVSYNGGSTWCRAAASLTLDGTVLTDTIYLTDVLAPLMRLNCTRTAGSLTIWCMQDDDSSRPS